MARELELPEWPDGAKAAVSITFDVDAEAGFMCDGPEFANRLTTLSEGRFGPTRGLPRILELLRDFAVTSTFYVPGETALRHAAAIEAIVENGHELGHHGHFHLRSDRATEKEQRAEIEDGLEALDRAVGIRPTGYRSASWELTRETLALLVEHGFSYDSSCMGDDRPYIESYGQFEILELPVHWSLDDWPYFYWGIDHGGALTRPDDVLDIWRTELAAAEDEGRHITFTMHPEIIGRSHRLDVLRGLLEAIHQSGKFWVASHDQVARWVAQSS